MRINYAIYFICVLYVPQFPLLGLLEKGVAGRAKGLQKQPKFSKIGECF
jgi:hypothetical protein